MTTLKPGDRVAYITRDFHGEQYIFSEVCSVGKRRCGLVTIPNGVSLSIEHHVLTKVQTVWADTMKPVALALMEAKKKVPRASKR